MNDIKGSVALVTGANRGLGAAFVRGLIAEGASTVYAATRSDYQPDQPGIVPIRLDITDPERIKEVAAELSDVNLVVNNAGVAHLANALDPNLSELIKTELETNLHGTIAVSQAFAPVLAANGGGTLVNVLSVASWRSLPNFASYGLSKAAQWFFTNSLRLALRPNGTLVVGVHAGFIDTDLAAGVTAPKNNPDDVVAAVFDGIRKGDEEVVVDELSRNIKASLSAPLTTMYPLS